MPTAGGDQAEAFYLPSFVADFDCGRVGRFRPVEDSMVPIGGISIELIMDFYSHFILVFRGGRPA
jgi:hypothetical protein